MNIQASEYGDELSTASERERTLSKWIWVLIWTVLSFCPAIVLKSGSKLSPAVILAFLYVLARIVRQSFPALDQWPSILVVSISLYLGFQGTFLMMVNQRPIVFLLQAQWVTYFLAGFLLAYDIGYSQRGRSFLRSSIVYIGVVAAILGIVSIFTGPFYEYAKHTEARWKLPINRAVGTFEAPSVLAAMLSVCVLLLFFSKVEHSSLSRKLSLLVMMAALIGTQSKAGILGTFLAILIGALLSRRTRVVVVSLVLLCVVGGAIYWVTRQYQIDVGDLIETDVEDRGTIIHKVIDKYVADDLAPELFGIGYRQSATRSPDGIWITAHNSYVAFLREIGVFGLAMIVLFLAVLLHKLIQGEELFPWAIALLGLGLMAVTETFLYATHSSLFLGAAGGLVCSLPEESAADLVDPEFSNPAYGVESCT